MTGIVSLLLAGPVASQEAPGRLVPAESTTVLVDVVVRDRKGRPVSGPGAADFEVLEDGVPQKLSQFSLAGSAAGAGPETTGATVTTPDAAATSPGHVPRRRPTIAFVFDRLSTEGRVAAQKAVRTFAAKAGLGTVAGVFSLEETLLVVQDFSADPALLVAAVDSLGTRAAHAGSTIANQARGRMRAKIRANADLARLARMSDPTNNAEGAARGQAVFAAAQSAMAAAAEDAFERLDRDQHGLAAASALAAIVDAMRAAPGRKAIVLFSEGLFRTEANEDPFLSVVNGANRASVSVYAVEAGGLATQSLEALAHDEIDSSAGVRMAQQDSGRDTGGGAFSRGLERVETLVRFNPRASLEWMSDSTGGFFVHDTIDFAEPLDRIEADLRSYYLLGYTPSNETYDGRFRKIARVLVVVSVPGRVLSTLASKKGDGGVDLTALRKSARPALGQWPCRRCGNTTSPAVVEPPIRVRLDEAHPRPPLVSLAVAVCTHCGLVDWNVEDPGRLRDR